MSRVIERVKEIYSCEHNNGVVNSMTPAMVMAHDKDGKVDFQIFIDGKMAGAIRVLSSDVQEFLNRPFGEGKQF